MDRNFVFLMLVALTAPVLAGCTAQAMPVGSAEAARPPAEEAAHAWAQDARLVAIAGIEGSWAGGYSASYGFSYNSDAQEASAKEDTKTDGRAEMWAYRYISSSKALAYNVVVDQDGNIIGAEEDDKDDDDVAIGSYKVTSTEAVAKALAANEDLAESQKDPNHGSIVVLGRDEDHPNPVWVIMGMSHGNDSNGGMVIIDAVTGDIIASMPFGNWGQSYDWSGFDSGYPGCGPYC